MEQHTRFGMWCGQPLANESCRLAPRIKQKAKRPPIMPLEMWWERNGRYKQEEAEDYERPYGNTISSLDSVIVYKQTDFYSRDRNQVYL